MLVAVVFALFAATALLGTRFPRLLLLSNVLLGGFIGGFTNTVAIKMLFEKRWYLPGSGVLLKSRERIINTLADTVEKHVLNTELLEEWLREKLARVDKEDIRKALNSVIEEFREDVARYVRSDVVRERLIGAAEDVIDRMGFIRHMVRLLTSKREITERITSYISAEVSAFEVSDSMMDGLVEKMGSLEDVLLKPNNPIIMRHYNSGEAMAGYFLGQLNIRKRVVERLSGYPPEKITSIVEDNIREHLVWLEIFGVLLGCVFSGMFEAVQYLLSSIPQG